MYMYSSLKSVIAVWSALLQLVTKIRLHNTKLGITTVWSLSKFESRLEQMREVYEVGCYIHVLD